MGETCPWFGVSGEDDIVASCQTFDAVIVSRINASLSVRKVGVEEKPRRLLCCACFESAAQPRQTEVASLPLGLPNAHTLRQQQSRSEDECRPRQASKSVSVDCGFAVLTSNEEEVEAHTTHSRTRLELAPHFVLPRGKASCSCRCNAIPVALVRRKQLQQRTTIRTRQTRANAKNSGRGNISGSPRAHNGGAINQLALGMRMPPHGPRPRSAKLRFHA